MGGIYSGRQASHEPSIEDFYSLDVCLLYRRGFLEPNVEDVIWLPNGYGIEIVCKENYWGWERCIIVEYLSRQADGKVKRNEQVIGIEFVDVLNGKARRPYFYCPKLEERVIPIPLLKYGQKTHSIERIELSCNCWFSWVVPLNVSYSYTPKILS